MIEHTLLLAKSMHLLEISLCCTVLKLSQWMFSPHETTWPFIHSIFMPLCLQMAVKHIVLQFRIKELNAWWYLMADTPFPTHLPACGPEAQGKCLFSPKVESEVITLLTFPAVVETTDEPSFILRSFSVYWHAVTWTFCCLPEWQLLQLTTSDLPANIYTYWIWF